MLSPKRVTALLAGGFVTAAFCFGQFAISTHSGLVQITLGSVFLEDKPLHKTTTNMVEVKPGQTLRTGQDGNAEVLLTPGVFLRLANSSSIRMDANSLSDTRVSLLTGSAMVECDELLEGNAVSFTVGNQPVQFKKKGLYRLEAEPAAVAAVKGTAFVAGSINAEVKQGKLLQFDSAAAEPVKFHLNKKDDLYAFSQARSQDSVYATGVTSSSLFSSGYTGCSASSWYPMSGVGMYSYLPCGGVYSNPFGYSFLGLNAGYLWDGPMYYAAPYALYGYGYRSGYGYGSGFVNGGGGGGVPSKTPNTPTTPAPGNSKGALPGNGQGHTPVPIFAGPGFHGRAPDVNAMRSVQMQGTNNIHTMAGPALGRSATMNATHAGSYGPSGGGGFHGGGAAAVSGPPSGMHSSAPMSSGGHSGSSASHK